MKPEDLKRWRETVLAKAVARRPVRERMVRSGGESVSDIYTAIDRGDADSGLPGE